MNDNELRHYGVPGMKWGVRKDKEVISKHNTSLKSSTSSGNSDNGHTRYIDAMKAKGKEPLGKKAVNAGKSRYTPKKVANAGDKIVNALEDSADKLEKAAEHLQPTKKLSYNGNSGGGSTENNGAEVTLKSGDVEVTVNTKDIEEILKEVDMDKIVESLDGLDESELDTTMNYVADILGEKMDVSEEEMNKVKSAVKKACKAAKTFEKGTKFVKGVYDRSIDTTKGYIDKGAKFVNGVTSGVSGVYNKSIETTKGYIDGFTGLFKKKK